MKKLIARLLKQEDPSVYQLKDGQLEPTLRTIDLIGLGTGMVVGTAIFTLPGIVAAEHTGPAVPLAFIVAAIGLDCRPWPTQKPPRYCPLPARPFLG